MDEEEIRQIWAEGEDWVIKRQNDEYFHRPDQKYGDWRPGLPDGVFEPDIEMLFNDQKTTVTPNNTAKKKKQEQEDN